MRNARRCRRLTLSVKSDRLDLSLRSCDVAQGFVVCVPSLSSVQLLIKSCQFFSTSRGPGFCLQQEGGRGNTFAVRHSLISAPRNSKNPQKKVFVKKRITSTFVVKGLFSTAVHCVLFWSGVFCLEIFEDAHFRTFGRKQIAKRP